MGRKGTLISETKLYEQSKPNEEFSHHFPWQADVQMLPGKQGSITRSGDLGRQMSRHPKCPPSSSCPQILLLSMMSGSVGCPQGQPGSVIPAMFPPGFVPPQPTCCCMGKGRAMVLRLHKLC